jgi:t-SNARE complex subunit (syntaxin)
MSFSSSLTSSELSELPTAEQFPVIISSIQQKLSSIRTFLSSVKTQSLEKRAEAHANLKSCNELAKKMQQSLNKLNNPSTKLIYTNWKKKLEHELSEVTRFAKILIKCEESYSKEKDFKEEDAFLSTQQQSLEFEVEMHNDIVKERDEKINRITQTIVTVNSMLKDLGEMVCEQGYFVDGVEKNIEESALQSKLALMELSKAEKESQGGKQRTCLLVLFVVLLIFVVALAGSTFWTKSTIQKTQ